MQGWFLLQGTVFHMVEPVKIITEHLQAKHQERFIAHFY